MLNNRQSMKSLDAAKRAADIIFCTGEGHEPYRSKDEITLIMKLLNETANSCVMPSNIVEIFDVVINGKK